MNQYSINFIKCPHCGEFFPIDLKDDPELQTFIGEHLSHLEEDENFEVCLAEGSA